MVSETTLPMNRLTLRDKLGLLVFAVARLPLNIFLGIVTKPFTKTGRNKTFLRAIADRIILSLVSNSSRRTLRVVFGTTRAAYHSFIKAKRLKPTVEDLGEDARLLWIGEKRTDKVILYFHGGAYLIGAPSCDFWYFAQTELEKRGKSVGCAVLNYTLVPDQTFPVQLRQGVSAIQHLLDCGVAPENLILVGDSAGAAFIHQIISHILHPLHASDVPLLKLTTPLGGAYLMSPWVAIAAPNDGSFERMDGKGDILSSGTVRAWGEIVLKDVPRHALPYIDANQAPIAQGWYDGIQGVVGQILVSAGGIECMRDSMIEYYEKLKVKHPNVEVYVEEYGTHNGPYYDVLLGDTRVRKLSKKILDWLDERFSS